MADLEDSRTALAGRKRDFQETATSEDTHMFTEEEPLPKRVKNYGELSGFAPADGSVANASSETHAPTLADEAAGLSPLPAIQGSSVFIMLKEDSNQGPMTLGSEQAMSSSMWNTGVASGLRTSFGSKAKGKRKALSQALADNLEMGMPEFARPFRELTKNQLQGPPESSREDDNDVSDSGEDDDEDEIDDSDLYQKGGQPISQHVPTVSDDILAVLGPRPVPPPHFQKLSHKQKKKMTKQEGKKYRRAAHQYVVKLNQYRIALREYDAKLGNPQSRPTLPSEFERNPKRLTTREVSELSAEDQKTYQVVFGAVLQDRREFQRDKKTQEAEKVLSLVKKWPLPDTNSYQKISANIRKGKTLYPSYLQVKKGIRPYTCKAGTFKIQEIFDDEGLPIVLYQFSYNLFVSNFLLWNRELWDSMGIKILRGSFNQYLAMFYSHVQKLSAEVLAEVQSTADDSDAITLAAAQGQLIRDDFIPRFFARAQAALVDGEMDTNGHTTAMQDTPAQLSTASSAPRNFHQAVPPVMIPSIPTRLKTEGDDIAMTTKAPSLAHKEVSNPKMANVDLSSISETLVFLQKRYYPSANHCELRCLACAQTGHLAEACPKLSCAICGIQGRHSTVMCPRDMPCEKCRARDHSISGCTEKLSMPRSEMSCDICGSANHLETECPKIWRSYESPNPIIRVSGIPVYCFSCGDADHYGPDCNMYQGPGVYDAEYTFTGTNLFKYLDKNSQCRAISAGIDYSISRKSDSNKGYKIKGKGKGKAEDPISLDDSDDEEFIRPSVRSGNFPRGNIKFGNGQAPQTPFRSGEDNRNQMTVSLRGGRGRGGGNGGNRGGAGRGGGGGAKGRNDTNTQAQSRNVRANRRSRASEAPRKHR